MKLFYLMILFATVAHADCDVNDAKEKFAEQCVPDIIAELLLVGVRNPNRANIVRDCSCAAQKLPVEKSLNKNCFYPSNIFLKFLDSKEFRSNCR